MSDKSSENGRPTSALLRVMQVSLGLILIGILGFFIYGQFFTDPVNYFTGECRPFDNSWTYQDNSGHVHNVMLPASLEIKPGETVTLVSRLPSDIPEATYLCFLTSRSMRVYVDSELRLDFDSSDNPLPGGYVKSHYIFAELGSGDSGKQIVIACHDVGEDNSAFNEVLIGDKMGIFRYLFQRHGGQFIAVVILFIISLIFLVVVITLQILYRRKFYIIDLAAGVMLLSLWFIFDSFLYQIAMKNYFVDGPMEYMLVMTIPFFFLLCLNAAQQSKHENVLMAAGIIYVMMVLSVTISHFSGYRSFQDNLSFTGAMGILLIIVMLATITLDIISGHVRRYGMLVGGFVALFVAALIQAVQLITTYDNHNAYSFIVGLYLMLASGVFTFVRDIADIRDDERYTQHVSELKSSFLANMSHEIRTPVNAILGMNEMISRETTEPAIRTYSENIAGAGVNLLGIINDILDFTKIESGKLELVNGEYSLKKLILNIDNQIGEIARRKNIEFSTEVDPELPDELFGDENRVTQVLLNLLNNGVKYTPSGSVKLKVGFSPDNDIASPNARNTVMISFAVTDTGIGIKPDDVKKLFNKFERLDLQKNRNIEGTGLGLAITNNLVHAMDGHIDVESVYGEGSTFTAHIRQVVNGSAKVGNIHEEKKAAEQEKKEVYKPSFSAPEADLLVVDDSPVNVMVVKGLLKQTDIRIDQALSGKECLEKCASKHYDVILLDHMMPEMDGIETLHRLKDELHITIPVIALTANAIEGMREMYLSEGFSGYLTKPTDPKELEDAVARSLPPEKLVKT